MIAENFSIEWIDRERNPKCAPNPNYPDGIDVDLSLYRRKTPAFRPGI